MATDQWSSRAGHELSASFRSQCATDNTPCHLCGMKIDYNAAPNTRDAFEADHFYPRSTHPELTLDPANLRASHHSCNRARGNRPVTGTLGTPSEVW